MAGSLSIPNHIGSQAGPRAPAALFDENWETIANYVNAREVIFDVVSNRPGAGVPGRWFYATDQSTLYLDNATGWITVVGGGSGGGMSPLSGSSNQNSVYDNTNANRFTLTASRVVVSALGGNAAHSLASVSVVADLATFGAGGRDQAIAFGANVFVHLYWIFNPTTATVAALISAAGWPAAVPTLPAGFSEVAYAGAARLNASGQFEAQSIRERRTLWYTPPAVLTSGTASTATPISLASVIPPNAQWVWGFATMQSTTAPAGAETVHGEISMDTGAGAPAITKLSYVIGATQAGAASGAWEGYPRSQQLYYRIVDAGGAAADGTNQLTVTVTGWENPNGG